MCMKRGRGERVKRWGGREGESLQAVLSEVGVGPRHPECYQALEQKRLSSALDQFTQLRERSATSRRLIRLYQTTPRVSSRNYDHKQNDSLTGTRQHRVKLV